MTVKQRSDQEPDKSDRGNRLHDPGHPIWGLLRFVVISAVTCFGLYMNASNFDETELKSLLWTLAAIGGFEIAGFLLRKKDG